MKLFGIDLFVILPVIISVLGLYFSTSEKRYQFEKERFKEFVVPMMKVFRKLDSGELSKDSAEKEIEAIYEDKRQYSTNEIDDEFRFMLDIDKVKKECEFLYDSYRRRVGNIKRWSGQTEEYKTIFVLICSGILLTTLAVTKNSDLQLLASSFLIASLLWKVKF